MKLYVWFTFIVTHKFDESQIQCNKTRKINGNNEVGVIFCM